jgi:hypothetical protein
LGDFCFFRLFSFLDNAYQADSSAFLFEKGKKQILKAAGEKAGVENLQKTLYYCYIEASMSVNRQYKDSVFSILFSDPETLRELFGALKLTNDELKEAIKQAVKWCIANNKLKQFLQAHGAEVTNMLMTEWNQEEALVVCRDEGREEAQEEIAKNALVKGFPMESISEITGLSVEDIKRLAGE